MRRVHGGFTLVEMLVALSIAVLLVSLVYGAVRIGHRSAVALGVHSDEEEIMRIGWQFIHHAVTRAQPVPDPADSSNRTGFMGTPDGVEFVADMPGQVTLGGLMQIRVGIAPVAGRDQLVLTQKRLDYQADAQTLEEHASQAVLVEDLQSLRIEYFGQQGQESLPAWHTSWDAPRTLPNLLRISVQPTAGGAWPVLVARPLLGSAPLPDNIPVLQDEGFPAPGVPES